MGDIYLILMNKSLGDLDRNNLARNSKRRNVRVLSSRQAEEWTPNFGRSVATQAWDSRDSKPNSPVYQI